MSDGFMNGFSSQQMNPNSQNGMISASSSQSQNIGQIQGNSNQQIPGYQMGPMQGHYMMPNQYQMNPALSQIYNPNMRGQMQSNSMQFGYTQNNMRPSFPQNQVNQKSKRTAKPQPQKQFMPTHSSQGQSNRSSQAYSPVTVPSNVPQVNYDNDQQTLLAILNDIPDDRLDLLFKLFISTSFKRKDERIEFFKMQLYTKLGILHCLTVFRFLLDGFKLGNEVFLRFKDPPLPLAFARVRNTVPQYFNWIFHNGAFDVLPISSSPRKGDLYVIGHFLTLQDQIPPMPIKVNNLDIPATRNGDRDIYYNLATNPTGPLRIMLGSQVQSVATWFIVQHAEKRDSIEVLQSLLVAKGIPLQNINGIQARTPSCKGCWFDSLSAIEGGLTQGRVVCPRCGTSCTLNEIDFDQRSFHSPMPTPISPSPALVQPMQIQEEDESMRLARLALADHMCVLLKPVNIELDWESVIFSKKEKSELPPWTSKEYDNTDDFLNAIDSL